MCTFRFTLGEGRENNVRRVIDPGSKFFAADIEAEINTFFDTRRCCYKSFRVKISSLTAADDDVKTKSKNMHVVVEFTQNPACMPVLL